MKVLITGANGMVGKNICNVLNGYDLLAPSSKELDLLKLDAVEKYIELNSPDFIIHCAGKVGGIQANIENPVSFLSENIIMGFNLINSAKKYGVKKLLNLGSSCMYPKDYQNPLEEEYILDAPLEPTNEGYALAKISTAKLCEYISKENGDFNYKTLIPCNLYGYFDNFDPINSHMIPAVIRKIHSAKINNEKSVEIWGDGKARREFMFSEDLAFFIRDVGIPAIEKIPTYLNVGLGFDHTITEYYEEIAKVIGYEGEFEFDLSRPVGMMQKLVSVKKLDNLGWRAQTTLSQGLNKTYEYFLKKEVDNV